MPISQSKISLIHVAINQLGIDDNEYRAILRSVANVTSAKELSEKGFNDLMNKLSELGFKTKTPSQFLGQRNGMATPKQVAFIQELWRQYTGGKNESSLNHWLENSFGVTNIRFVSTDIAAKAIPAKAIPALKAMTKRNNSGASRV